MKKLIILSLISLFAISCSSSNNEPFETVDTTSKLAALLDTSKSYHTLDVHYDDEYFFLDSSKFNIDLAKLSYTLANANTSLEWVSEYFTNLPFDNFHASKAYTEGNTNNSHSMFLAHRKIRDYDLVSISFLGGDYGREWVSNFDVGESGDHAGFSYSASNAIEELKEYLSIYNKNNIKLWLTGYSRGGALSNVLASRIPDQLNINPKNIYAYTFEAPRGIEKSNLKNYKNVFNIVNSYDIVQALLPEKYNLYREGIDIDIYQPNFTDYMKELIPSIAERSFVPEENHPTAKEFLNDFMNTILDIKGGSISISDRKTYVKNLQEPLKEFASIIGQFSFPALMEIGNEFSSFTVSDMLSLLSGDGFYNYLKPILDRYGIEYTEDTLKPALKKITSVLMNYYISLRDFTAYSGNLINMVLMHIPEYNLVLLDHYE